MIEGYLALVVVGVALGSFFLGRWAGAREERGIWTTAALNAPDDYVRARGRDYAVMRLNNFYRDYYNPLAGLRFAEARRLSPTDGAPEAPPKVRTPTSPPNPETPKGRTP